MGEAYDRIASAKRAPNDDPPETMEEAVSSLGAGFLDLLGEDAVHNEQPMDLGREIHRRFPGFVDWWRASGLWEFKETCNEAWQLAYEASGEMSFSEIVDGEGLVR